MTGQESVQNPPVEQHKRKRRRSKGPKPETKPFTDGLVEPVRLLPLSKFTFRPVYDIVDKKDDTKTTDVEITDGDKNNSTPAQAPTTAPVSVAVPVPPAQGAPGAPVSIQDKDKKKANDARLPKSKAYHKKLKVYNLSYGSRRYVQFLVCVGPDPRIFLFKAKDELIPGGYLSHDEEESEGIKRLWMELFHVKSPVPVEMDDEVESLHVIGQWYRPDSGDELYPYKSRYLINCKEHIKTYLVQLKAPMQIRYPLLFKELLVTDLYDAYDMKDPIVSSIPYLLSRFTFTS